MMVFGLSCIPKRPSGHSLPPRLLAEQLGRAPASLQVGWRMGAVATPPGRVRTGGEADRQRARPSAPRPMTTLLPAAPASPAFADPRPHCG
jgi:hypothetical protein